MSEVRLKDQCFGVEVELTGITREQATQALADYFGTVPRRGDDYYDSWYVRDGEGKEWRLMSDSSIRGEQKVGARYTSTSDPRYRVENKKWVPDTPPPQIRGIVWKWSHPN